MYENVKLSMQRNHGLWEIHISAPRWLLNDIEAELQTRAFKVGGGPTLTGGTSPEHIENMVLSQWAWPKFSDLEAGQQETLEIRWSHCPGCSMKLNDADRVFNCSICKATICDHCSMPGDSQQVVCRYCKPLPF